MPDGIAISIMNPSRDRTSESTAQNLIKDLRGLDCKKIASGLHSDPNAICPTLRENRIATLVWRKDNSTSRLLVYSLQGQHARLWIMFNRDEAGFDVSSLSMMK